MEFLFFDWYSCGIDKNPDEIQLALSASYPLGTWEFTKPKRGYDRAAVLLSPDMSVYCTLWWGGTSQGRAVHAFSTGSMANTFASVVRQRFPSHYVNRIDVAIDYNSPGTWASLHSLSEHLFKKKFVRSRALYHGPSGMHSADTLEGKGRTLELGSRQSVHFARFYEKGKKDDKTQPNWCRVEVEFKPRREARYKYAHASPAEILAATAMGSEILRVLLNSTAVRPCAAGAMRVQSDFDRTLEALRKQYGPFIRKALESNYGGDINACLADIIAISA